MRKFNLVKLSILKILLIGGIGVQTFSCTTEIEPPPPLSNELSSSSSSELALLSSSSSEAESSSSVELGSSSSEQSSSSVVPSSSSGEAMSSSSVELGSSSSVAVSSSSFVQSSSSSVMPSSSSVAPSSSSSGCMASDNTETQYCSNGVIKTYGILTDNRESPAKTYRTVVIGTQTWMAENLNYNADGSLCYGDNTGGDSQNHCGTYGRLYRWATAIDVCPSGWHLPSNVEWTTLTDYVESQGVCIDCAGTRLKATSTSGWISTDNHGFSALLGGYRHSDGRFINVGNDGYWWSSTKNESYLPYGRYMYYLNSNVTRFYYDEVYGFSVRCVQDE